jgi:uncharacterized protein (TIGR03435 family)
LEAILAHELRHVERRDNLTAAIHMLVETIFWFHPCVWWIRARLMEERERACDEEVVRMGSEPQVYAESILKVCEFYLTSPVPCAGVTGGELKKRIEGIMANRIFHKLNFAQKLLLAVAAIGAVGGPIAVGLAGAPRAQSQAQAVAAVLQIAAFPQATGAPAAAAVSATAVEPNPPRDERPAVAALQTQHAAQPVAAPPAFEVASVKLVPPPEITRDYAIHVASDPERIDYRNVQLVIAIREAYGVTWELEAGTGPASIWSERYDIQAKIPPNTPKEQVPLMLQALLEERFRLAVHWEKKQRSAYALVVGKGGLKIAPVSADSEKQPSIRVGSIPGGLRMTCELVPMDRLARNLNQDRPVFNTTGIEGVFSFTLEYSNAALKAAPPSADSGEPSEAPLPPIRKAVQDKLGLELESRVIPVNVLIVDHAERVPTEN